MSGSNTGKYSIMFQHQITAAAAATKDACCAATTWEIFDEQSKGTDQGMADDGVYGGAGSKAEVGGEETAVQRQAGELATVTLARYPDLGSTTSFFEIHLAITRMVCHQEQARIHKIHKLYRARAAGITPAPSRATTPPAVQPFPKSAW